MKCHFYLFLAFHRYFTSFEYNLPPVVVINTDYAFIRLVDKSKAISKLVQVSKRDLAINNDSMI